MRDRASKHDKLPSNLKSQAALEFLTTYAWAFLVILIMIGALAYFGILAPSKLLPNRCNFNAGIGCEGYEIGSDGTFNLKLKNNLGGIITVTGIVLSAESSTAFTCATPPTNPVNWPTGNITELLWTGCNSAALGFVSGEKGKILVKINYYEPKNGPAYGSVAQGEVYETVS